MAVKDLTNKKFGKLTVLERDLTKKTAAAYWICQCECGNKKSIRGDRLRNGEVKNCGCEKIKRNIDTTSLVGKKFGRLKVLARDLDKPIGHGHDSYWICECECGKTTSVAYRHLTKGTTKSCGCLRSEITTKRNTLDLTNKRYGKLTAIRNTFKLSNHNSYLWECQCDCGNICYLSAEVLQAGNTKSCGCIGKSLGEEKICQILTDNNILFNSEVTFSDLQNPKTNKSLRYDFAILNENNQIIRLIEFDGEQHFIEKDFFRDALTDIQYRDNIKNEYAKNHNIPLVRIPYTELDNLSLELILGDKYLLKGGK